MDPEQILLQANPKLCDSGSTLYYLLVTKTSLSTARGHTENSVYYLQHKQNYFSMVPLFCTVPGLPLEILPQKGSPQSLFLQ